MLTYKKLARKPRSFQSFTGISLEQFDFLSSEIEKEYKRTEQRRLSRKKRERKIGAGRRFALPVRDRLMMLLVYYRMYITYELAGHLFGLDQSNVYRDIRYMEPAVRGSIPIPQKMMYAESKKIGTIQDLERYFPEFCVMIDSSEQQIPRPKKNKKKRQTHYSGKKGMHTVKNQYTVNLDGQIVHKPPHSPGRPHDYKMFQAKHPTMLPEGLQTFVDLGYEGMARDFPEFNPVLPCKRKGGKRLTARQKEFNRNQSRIRITVEHTISKIKKFRIMQDVFRNRLRRYDCISDIICSLVNFRIRQKDFVVIP